MRNLSPTATLDILQRCMDLFDVEVDLQVFFDCPNMKSNVVAYFQPSTTSQCYRSNYIPEYVPMHEFFHFLSHYYGNACETESECESFARLGEAIWLRTNGQILDFVCETCGVKPSRILFLPSGDFSCKNCGAVYNFLWG